MRLWIFWKLFPTPVCGAVFVDSESFLLCLLQHAYSVSEFVCEGGTNRERPLIPQTKMFLFFFSSSHCPQCLIMESLDSDNMALKANVSVWVFCNYLLFSCCCCCCSVFFQDHCGWGWPKNKELHSCCEPLSHVMIFSFLIAGIPTRVYVCG